MTTIPVWLIVEDDHLFLVDGETPMIYRDPRWADDDWGGEPGYRRIPATLTYEEVGLVGEEAHHE